MKARQDVDTWQSRVFGQRSRVRSSAIEAARSLELIELTDTDLERVAGGQPTGSLSALAHASHFE
jgi:hypothetical protein